MTAYNAAMKPLRILIADDEPLNREVAEVMLRSGGHMVVSCSDGSQVIPLCDRTDVPYDVFFLDLDMPGVDGIEVCRQLRARADTRETPIVIVTAMVSGEHEEEARQAGGDLFVTKPYRMDDLLAALAEVVVGRGSSLTDAAGAHWLRQQTYQKRHQE